MIPNWKIYPRSQGHSMVYLKNVVTDPAITVGDYTISTPPATPFSRGISTPWSARNEAGRR